MSTDQIEVRSEDRVRLEFALIINPPDKNDFPVIRIPETLLESWVFSVKLAAKQGSIFFLVISVGNPGILIFPGNLGRKPGNVNFSNDLSGNFFFSLDGNTLTLKIFGEAWDP